MHEAANGLIRVHKASTQNQKLRTKTSKISMSQRDNRKSCHSDQISRNKSVPFQSHKMTCGLRGQLWGLKPAAPPHYYVSEPRRFPPPWSILRAMGVAAK